MNIPQAYKDVRWWKAYVIYLVIVMPLLVVDYLLIPGSNWLHAGILMPILIVAVLIKDPIQRRLWR